MSQNYTPNPLKTDVELPDYLKRLRETIAEQVHETWAEQRVKEGWVYGKVRSDEEKTTPCLIPYSDLPENEKDFDRNTAEATLKFILSKGYKIIDEHKDETRLSDEEKKKKMEAYYKEIEEQVRTDVYSKAYYRPDKRLELIENCFDNMTGTDISELTKEMKTFINNETYDTAKKVYKEFFDLFQDKDGKLNSYLDNLHAFEEKASTLNNKQRDHFVHSVNVFILGLVIYKNNPRMRELIQQRIRRQGLNDPDEAFLHMWGIAALMHDIGYPAEIIHTNLKGYFDMINDNTGRGGNDVNPYIGIEYFDKFNSIEVSSDEIRDKFGSRVGIYIKPLDLISERLAEIYNFGSDKTLMTPEKMKQHIDSYFSYMHSAGFTDHGYFSAVMVLRQFAYMLRNESLCDDFYSTVVVEAAAAIFLHNSWRYMHNLQDSGRFYVNKPSGKSGNKPDKLSPEQFPLGYLMILCDELQDWNRTAYGKSDKEKQDKGYVSEAAGIGEVSGDKFCITYYTKSVQGQDSVEKFREKKYGDIDRIIDIKAIFPMASKENFADSQNIIDIYLEPMVKILRKTGNKLLEEIAENKDKLYTSLDNSARFIFQRYNDLNRKNNDPVTYENWEDAPLTIQLSNIRQASQTFQRIIEFRDIRELPGEDKKKWEKKAEKGNYDLLRSEEFSAEEIEKMAAIEHDFWSSERIANGWNWALEKNIAEKRSHCFLEYEDLPEYLKVYDREAVKNSLAILEMIFGLYAVKKDDKKE